MSVIVFGRYEELLDTPEWRSERELAWKLLRQHAMWWEPGYAKTIVHGTERSLAPVFYRIHVAQVTGRRTLRSGRSRRYRTAEERCGRRRRHYKRFCGWFRAGSGSSPGGMLSTL